MARDLVNRIQNLRKDYGFEVTDKISLKVENKSEKINQAIMKNYKYICSETLTNSLQLVDHINKGKIENVEFGEELETHIKIVKDN